MFSARRALGTALSKLSSQSEKAPFASSRLPEILIQLRTTGTHASQRADTEDYGDSHGDFDRNRDISQQISQNAQYYDQNNTYSQGQFHHTASYNQSNQETYNNSHYSGGYNQQLNAHNPGQFYQSHGVYDQQVHQYPNVSTNNNANVETPKYRGTIEELEGLCKEGKLNEAFEVLALLEENKTQIGHQTWVLLVKACGDESDLKKARHIHEHILRNNGAVEIALNNKILDMYIKCGSLDDAQKLFNEMLHRNLTSWETMILALAKDGKGEEALELFNQLKTSGLPLDAGIFSSIFFVCGVVGAVDEGMLHLKSMEEDYQIAPDMGTYGAIVNMLGQCGYLEEALDFVEQMPVEPTVDIWEMLMNLARLTGHLELGSRCAAIVEQMDPTKLDKNSQSGLVPVNQSELEKEKQRSKASRLEGRAQSRQYVCGDRRDPEHKKIYTLLNRLAAQMKEAGYVPDTRFVLHDVDQEAKEEALLGHSERLAAAYAFMTSPARTPIRIIKNLRCCGDCHNALKIISRLVGREIIARDAKRFHNFKDGVCSCKDYW
ncbi:pentatricopeptide repeat-containing protein At2g25580-like [Carex rostrata]